VEKSNLVPDQFLLEAYRHHVNPKMTKQDARAWAYCARSGTPRIGMFVVDLQNK